MEPACRAHGVPFPTLQEIADLPNDTYEAIVAQTTEKLDAVAGWIGVVKVPGIDAQFAAFDRYVSAHGGGFWEWPADARERLKAKLLDCGPGAELVPIYAMTCGIRLPDNELILVNRAGEVVKAG